MIPDHLQKKLDDYDERRDRLATAHDLIADYPDDDALLDDMQMENARYYEAIRASHRSITLDDFGVHDEQVLNVRFLVEFFFKMLAEPE